jgi:hypothetical protein
MKNLQALMKCGIMMIQKLEENGEMPLKRSFLIQISNKFRISLRKRIFQKIEESLRKRIFQKTEESSNVNGSSR